MSLKKTTVFYTNAYVEDIQVVIPGRSVPSQLSLWRQLWLLLHCIELIPLLNKRSYCKVDHRLYPHSLDRVLKMICK